ncbi:MAG: ribosome silencing factor [Bacteroidota bacterium]
MVRTKTLAKKIAQFTLDKKAHNVVLMDLRKVSDMTDFFIVCSADSDIQVKAIADAVTEGTDQLGVRTWHAEGLSQRQWVLLDYIDIVVHIFHKEIRKYYGIEKLWGDAKIEAISDEADEVKKTKKAKKVSGRKRA